MGTRDVIVNGRFRAVSRPRSHLDGEIAGDYVTEAATNAMESSGSWSEKGLPERQ